MKNWKIIFSALLFISCNEKLKEVDYSSNICQGSPSFIKKIVSNTTGIAFSTSENKKKGLWLVNALLSPNDPTRLVYQDSTWKMGGWLGPLLTDGLGNIWCAPVPVINILDNKTEEQNNLYQVNPTTGKMELFLQLPMKEKITNENPYGILGLAYNCQAKILYVSSVAGSTRKQQHGKIYCIDIENKKIKSTLNCGDAFGLGVSYKDGFRKLYFGNARNSNIYSIGLQENGSFLGDPQVVCSIEGLGPRGDDKAKKIREDKNGNLLVSGYEFNFNLTAPTEKQETIYTFTYNSNSEKWEYR